MRIRVLEVLASLARAGAERVGVTLARELDRTRFETGVVSLYDPRPGGFEPELSAGGVPVRHLGKRPGFDPRMWPRLVRTLREVRPDVIHSHSYILRYVFPACALARQGRIVHTVHNLAERDADSLGRAINRMAFRHGAVPVAISAALARSFESVYGFPPGVVIPNGIEAGSGMPAEAREAWRRARGFAQDDLLIASVARFDAQKNPLGLIEAFARTLPGGGPVHLVMAGAGPLLAACRARAASLDIAARVHFPGVCTDVPALLGASDIFALASEWEGSPVAVMEAMAAGLPVAATAVGGVPELVEEGVTGLLAPAGDVGALARALAALAGDPARRRSMGDAGAKRARRFDARAMVEAYGALFTRLCGSVA